VSNDPLATYYDSLESRYSVHEAPGYGALVVPTGNSTQPVHRWFHFKEAFSHGLLAQLIEDLGVPGDGLHVLDPFSGSGTTAVSALLMSSPLKGRKVERLHAIEVNPWLHLLSATKTEVVQRPADGAFELLDAIVESARISRKEAPLPSLSTFGRSDYLSEAHGHELVRLLAAVDCLAGQSGADAINEGDLARLLVGASVEPAMRLRRDGRALRYQPQKNVISPLDTFHRLAKTVEEDLVWLRHEGPAGHGVVHRGDARDAASYPEPGTVDLALFSPPYPNNIDYTEVYKLEAWILSLIYDQKSFRDQRLATLRSHPSIRFETPKPGELSPDLQTILAPVHTAIPAGDRYSRARIDLVSGYFLDMLEVLGNVANSLRVGGRAICVVGNSLHGSGDASVLIASDLLIAAVGELAGLRVDRISVARYPVRRRQGDQHRLRESLVVFTKA
jgi:hypothetical protein